MAIVLPNGFATYSQPVRYYIDGLNLFNNYGVAVSGSRGIISAPAIKQPFAHSWNDAHGESVDLSSVYYEAKEFSLDCWMLGTSNIDLSERINTLFAALSKPGLRRIALFVDNNKPLIFQVYLKGAIDVTKKWKVDQLIHADFTLTFREPEPLKIVLKGTVEDSSTIGITFSSTKPVSIRWGYAYNGNNVIQGTYPDQIDVIGDQSLFAQVFITDASDVYPVITGEIESITDLQLTGLTVLWNKLL